MRVAALMLIAAVRLSAQGAPATPIDTDRPDVTDGTHAVARGRLQFELGYTYQQARGVDAPHTQSVPELLVRIGVLRNVELRVGDNYLNQSSTAGAPGVHGLDDLYVGTKVSLSESRRAIPALGFELKTQVPTGSAAISANQWLPGAALLLGWGGDGPWSLGVEAFAGKASAGGGQGIGSASLQYQASGLLQFFGEYFTVQPFGNAGSGGAEHYFNAGALWQLNQNFQLDARIGFGLTQGSDRFFTGAGFAVRR